MHYYREPNGDYLAVNPSTKNYYVGIGQPNIREGRATAIAGLVESVCTTGVSLDFLAECTRIKRADVPKEWLARF